MIEEKYRNENLDAALDLVYAAETTLRGAVFATPEYRAVAFAAAEANLAAALARLEAE